MWHDDAVACFNVMSREWQKPHEANDPVSVQAEDRSSNLQNASRINGSRQPFYIELPSNGLQKLCLVYELQGGGWACGQFAAAQDTRKVTEDTPVCVMWPQSSTREDSNLVWLVIH